jgi:hypothetical protein
LKNAVPPVVIDPVKGGAKLRRQAEVLGWPVVFHADTVTDAELERAWDYCLSTDARADDAACHSRGVSAIVPIREQFLSWLHGQAGV